MARPQRVMTAEQMARILSRMAHQILETSGDGSQLALIGVHTRGAPLAVRLADRIEAAGGERPPIGRLDINLYRDDLGRARTVPLLRATTIPFDIDQRTVVLVDDVLHTGRTVRAALDALADLGRPARVRLAALIDRGGRELPIQPDVVGRVLDVAPQLLVEVRLAETDGAGDEVRLCPRSSATRPRGPAAAKGRTTIRRRSRRGRDRT